MIVVGHTLISDLSSLVRAGHSLPAGPYFCTETASHWLYPDQADHSLEHLVLRMTSMGQWRGLGTLKGKDFAGLSPEALRARNLGDAEGARRIYPQLAQELQARGVRPLWDLAMSVLPILAEIGGTGMALNQQELQNRTRQIGRWLDQEKHELEQALGIENLRSHAQLAARLFGSLGATPLQRTTTRWSTNRVSLLWAQHQARHQHQDVLEELLSRVLEYGLQEKLQTTYYRKWEGQPRVHALYSLGRTSTGRLASFSENLQNVPPRVRELVVPSAGYDYIVVGDQSQIELRVAAHVSGDRVMQRFLREGRDIHSTTTARVLGLPELKSPREVAWFRKKHERQRATGKMTNFACLAPETRVLKADLSWVSVGSLVEGDVVVGFDENLGWVLKVRQAQVLATSRQRLKTYRITTDRGIVEASGEHLWVALRSKKTGKHPYLNIKTWLRTDCLGVGDHLAFWTTPWDLDDSREAGYLAGFLDGEGSVNPSTKQQLKVTFAQNPGPTLERVLVGLRQRGYRLAERKRPDAHAIDVQICGSQPGGYGQEDTMRLLGSLRPTRLLQDAWKREPWRKKAKVATVLAVESLGLRDTVGLLTSTGTVVAGGFYTHNSIFGITAHSLVWKIFEDTDGEVLLSEAEAQSYINAFFSVFSDYAEHMRRGWEAIQRGDPVRSLFGFEWALPRTEEGWRCWLNYPVQGSATWLLMLGLRALHQRLRQERLHSRIIGTVHDNIILEVPRRELTRSIALLKETCEHPDTRAFRFALAVPLVMEVKAGSTWASLEEVGG